jgi:hypothetical protein
LGITDSNFDNLWLLVLITNIGGMVPLVFINLLPNEDPQATATAHQSLPPTTLLEHQLTNITGDRTFATELIELPAEKS